MKNILAEKIDYLEIKNDEDYWIISKFKIISNDMTSGQELFKLKSANHAAAVARTLALVFDIAEIRFV